MRWLIDIINRRGREQRAAEAHAVDPPWRRNPHACSCGPGFCADAKGIGYIGSCSAGDGERVAAPDCTRCGAPHQSTRGCWLCQSRSADMSKPQDPEDRAGTDFWLRCLREGIRGGEVFAMQDAIFAARGASATYPTPDEALDAVLAQRRGAP